MNALTPVNDPLDEFFRGFFVRPMDVRNGNTAVAAEPSVKMDVTETEKEYKVHAELPGAKKEDIHIAVDGNQVSISAEVQRQSEVKEGERVLRSERYFGQVSRAFQLAQDIDDAAAQAKFADGVLELTLPKKVAAASKKQIAVQ
jgi:HSP20 family protein